ncbi:hypothetical protein [uncultured Tenacibaculum sp.]|uniref:hypothetical protein n=1 Tax=uncultured Tenacibaculum sp. TaxID=174713 RepID=UPI00261F8FBA|nr:hypothetical protein [uncultured Tenacibaculum sp.]
MNKEGLTDKSTEELTSLLKNRIMTYRMQLGLLIATYIGFGYVYFYWKGDVFLPLFTLTMLYLSMIYKDFKSIKEIKKELNSKEKENK